jgi:prevent-host-death family protein
MEVNIHRAKTNLSRLILQAEAGEEVIIARAGKPAVKLVPVVATMPRKFKPGALQGRLFVPDNFLDHDPELESLFYDGPISPGEGSAQADVVLAHKTPSRKKLTPGHKDRMKPSLATQRSRTTR